MVKDGVMQGLLTWFDCWFTFGNKEVELSTSPYKKDTHWKQVVFYLSFNVYLRKRFLSEERG